MLLLQEKNIFNFLQLMHTPLHYTMLPALASHWLEEFANSSAAYLIIDQSFAACCNPFILKINEASETFKTCGVSYYGPEIFVRTF
jgi:hypothetical protein